MSLKKMFSVVVVLSLLAVMASVTVTPAEASTGKIMSKPMYGTFTVTREFGNWLYIPGYGWDKHTGIDIQPKYYYWVFAPADGKVVATGYDWRAGNYIVIFHTGYGNQYRRYCPLTVYTKYFHLAAIFVQPGQTITQGQLIGQAGNTGAWCTGLHLHFEIRENGQYGLAVNPREYIRFGDGKDIW